MATHVSTCSCHCPKLKQKTQTWVHKPTCILLFSPAGQKNGLDILAFTSLQMSPLRFAQTQSTLQLYIIYMLFFFIYFKQK